VTAARPKADKPNLKVVATKPATMESEMAAMKKLRARSGRRRLQPSLAQPRPSQRR
jgi:hypothetical protein